MNPAYTLSVVDGLKKGASVHLELDARLVIGDQIDCDIVLGDVAMLDDLLGDNAREPARTTLRHDSTAGTFLLQQVSGSVLLDGTAIAEGSEINVPLDTPVEIAGSVFVLNQHGQQAAEPVPNADHQLIDVSDSSESANAAEAKVEDDLESKQSNNRMMHLGIAAAFCIALAAVLTIWMDGKGLSVTAHDRASSLLAQLMEAPEYSQLELEQSGSGAIKVTGFVQQRAELQQLRKSLNGMEQTVFVDVSVGEIMAESVESVFMVNDVEALASSMANGEVLTGDTQLLEKIEAIAYADVAGLESLTIENAPPAIIALAEKPASNDFETLPGKRIVMVMATEPTYILTEDGSRYFTGSILPSGHRVKAILEKTVELELNQNTIEVVF